MRRFKVWVEIEEITDEESYQTTESVCIRDFDTYPEALRLLRALATAFDPEQQRNEDYAYPLEPEPDDTDWSSFTNTKRYELKMTRLESGYLELPPLHDQGSAEPGQAILWIKDSPDAEPKRFIYVWPEEVREVSDAE